MVKRWPLLLVPAIVVVAAGFWLARTPAPGPAPAPVTAPQAPAVPPVAPEAAKQQPGAVAPSFDIVRVAPDGSVVVAGRAAPGARVGLRENGTDIASAQADAQGQFVIVPNRPLAPGGRELTLMAQGTDGSLVPGSAPVVVVVPEHPGSQLAQNAPAPAEPVAVLTPPNAPPRVLQAPAAARGQARLGLDVVDYDEHGAVRFSGRAQPGATVRLYVDNALVGTATAGADGAWSLTPQTDIRAGAHRLRVDQIGPRGTVTARIALPFQRTEMAAADVPSDRVVVQPGQSLWRIARRIYGQGVRYMVIYQANRSQIRDPDLIYPGQVFSLPSSATDSIPAPSANKSR